MSASTGRTTRHQFGAPGWAKATLIALLGAIALAALLVAYSLLNPNVLKPVAASIVGWTLDRSLEIDGDLTLSLSWTPVVSVTNARFGNAPGAESPFMATADYALAQIDLTALFERRVHLLDLQTRGAELHLEDEVDGRPNWIFFDPDPESESAGWSFMLEKLQVADSQIFANIGGLAPIHLTIPQLTETSDQDQHLNLNGYGEINDDPWRLQGRIGPFDALMAGGRVELDLDMMIDDAEVAAVGSIDDLTTFNALDLALRIYGPDANLLGEILRMPEDFSADIALEATIRPDGERHALSMVGHIAAFEIETAGTIADLKNLDGWNGKISVTGPDAGIFGKALQIEHFPDGPFQVSGALHLWGGDLDLKDVLIRTDDVALSLNADFKDFPRREGAFGNFRLTGDDISQFRALLGLPGLPAQPFDLLLTLDASGNEVVTSQLKLGPHSLTAAGKVGEFPDFNGTRLTITASGDDVGLPMTAMDIDFPLHGPYQAAAELIREAGELSLTELELSTTGVRLDGSIVWPDLSQPGELSIDANVQLESLAATADLFELKQLPVQPLDARLIMEIADGRLRLTEGLIRHQTMEAQIDGALGPAGLADLQLDIHLSGASVDELFMDAIPDDGQAVPFELSTRLQGAAEGLTITGFQLETEGGVFNMDGFLSLTEQFVGSRFELGGRGTNLARLVPDFPGYQPPEQPWQISSQLELPEPGHLALHGGLLEIGSARVSLTGVLDSADQSRTELMLDASGDRVSDFGRFGNVPLPDYPFGMTVEMDGSLERINVTRLEGTWGVSDLTGTGSIELGDTTTIRVEGDSQVIDVYDLQHALFGEPEDEDPTDDSSTVFADTPIAIDRFEDYNIYLLLDVGRFRGQRSRLTDVKLELDIEEGSIFLKRFRYRDDLGYFDANATLRPEGDKVYMEFKLLGEEADFGILTSSEQPPESIPRYTLDVNIFGTGATTAEMAAGLNGTVLVNSDGGMINNDLLNAFTGDFLSNVLEVLNPFVENEPFTAMECTVLNASISDGQVSLEPGFVMRTDRVNMFVYGGVNLATERLDLSLATQARRGIGISVASITNPYFKIGGTLAAPALQLDPASAAVAASVATATAGLSILVRGVFDRLMGTRNPCPDFLKYEQKPPKDR